MPSLSLKRVLAGALLLQAQGIRGWPSSSSTFANSSSTSTTSSSISSTSSTASATITTPPIYCGGCELIYEVHAHNWWPTVLPAYAASVIYTVDEETGSTINSSIQYIPNPTPELGGVNFTTYISSDIPGTTKLNGTVITTFSPLVGGVEYTTLSGSAAEHVTITQVNGITFNASHFQNGYIYSTQFINTSLTGTAMTQCKGTYYVPLPNVTTPGMPAQTYYTYTTVVDPEKSWLWTTALPYGLDILASEVATYLGLGISNCTSAGGGVGTLKIGVTALTSYGTVYTSVPAQTEVSPPVSTPPPPPSPSIPSSIIPPTSTAVQQQPTTSPKTAVESTPPAQSTGGAANTPPAQSTGGAANTPPAQSTGGAANTPPAQSTGGGAANTPPASPTTAVAGASTSAFYTTTIEGTFTSNGVVKTTSFTTTAPVGSVIASLFGPESTTTTAAPAQFSGGAGQSERTPRPAWAVMLGLGALLAV